MYIDICICTSIYHCNSEIIFPQFIFHVFVICLPHQFHTNRYAMPVKPFLPPHIVQRTCTTAARPSSPLALSGYQPNLRLSGYNQHLEDSTSDDSPYYSSTVGHSILKGRALLIILQSVDVLPLPSRSTSSFSSPSSTGFPHDKYASLVHANQKLETDNLFLKGQIDALQ